MNLVDDVMWIFGYIPEKAHQAVIDNMIKYREDCMERAYKRGCKDGALQVINGLAEAVKKIDNPSSD